MPRTTAQNPPPADPILVKPSEACRRLGISDRHLRKLVDEGLIEVRYLDDMAAKNPHRRVVWASAVRWAEGLPQDPSSAA